MKNPHDIILRPHITEKTVDLSHGDPHILDEDRIQRSYTFVVAPDANKIEIKNAVEEIYNAGKREIEVTVEKVRTIKLHGKTGRRLRAGTPGRKPDTKKAVVTLAPGQVLEDYGV
ncbi:MAG TPA: 50S ribosomal protein L23 [Fimbriimonadaceae bacterium]|nr:50S ribosomal protein L23 [Fimbriimonadaceae bacterium]